jgi:peptide/nickel transport system permease protein
MGRYAVKRIIAMAPSIVIATIAVFFILRILPGDVALTILADTPHTVEMREALREELGLNDPAPVQYVRWLRDMVNGRFGGASLETGEPISEMASRQFPVTLLIACYSAVLSLIIGLPGGILLASKGGRGSRSVIRFVTVAGLSVPNILTASVVLLGLLLVFRWSPPVIYFFPKEDFAAHLQLVIWPVLILSWEFGSHLIRTVHAGMADALQSDHVKAARGRGIGGVSLAVRHALPSVGGPLLNVFGLQFGALLGGTLVLESIFGIPGVGRGLVQAAIARDLPVVQSYAALLVILFLMINLLVDVLHGAVDPRLRTGNGVKR